MMNCSLLLQNTFSKIIHNLSINIQKALTNTLSFMVEINEFFVALNAK